MDKDHTYSGRWIGGSDEQSVLFVDTDESINDGIADQLTAHLSDHVSLRGTTVADALATARNGPWDCLVLGNGLDRALTASLLDELACPSVLFTRTAPTGIPDTLLDQVDTLVERGNGDQSVRFLAEKIETLLTESSDALEGVLSCALSTVEGQVSDATALFLVDGTGTVVWSNRAFDSVFPVEDTDGSMPEDGDFYARLDTLLPDTGDDGEVVEVNGEADTIDDRSLVVPTAEQAWYYVYDRHPIPLDEGLTLEQFEDVTDRVHSEAHSRRLERLVEQAQDGLFTLDHNGVIDFCNESFATNLGYDREELLGEHAATTLARGELETGQETVQHLLDNPNQESTEVDMTFRTRSGEAREMSIHYTLLPTENETYGGLMGVVRDVTERNRREQALRESRERLRTVVENLPVVLFVADADGTITFADGAGFSDAPWNLDRVLGMTAADIGQEYPEIEGDLSRALAGETVDVVHEIEGRAYHSTYQPVVEDGETTEVIGVTMDVTDQRDRERQLVRQRDELSALNETNELIQEIIGALGSAASREELQQIVCEHLVDSGRYELAWIGERQGSNDAIVPLTSAGEPTAYLDDVDIRTGDNPSGPGPGGRAYRSGEVQVVPNIRSAEQSEPWRERALDAGFESVITIPLRHGETTHGILAVYATEPDAFSQRLTESFGVLGETIGLALTAVQNKRLLQRDTTVSLEFQSSSEDACLVWLASACDCTLETAGAVESDDGVVQYLRVDGTTPEQVVDAVQTAGADVEAAVTRTEGDRIVELHLPASLTIELSEVGARLDIGVIRPNGVRIVVEAPADADVRAIQDAIERFNPATELVSKTEQGEPTAEDLIDTPLAGLTDRQHEVLRAAYLSGYYDWPRESTAEELAASLGIASPTLHQHLRRAERNLLQRVLDLSVPH